eukprot:CAMPEP_0185212084 /NCGR_PEP_ID=MMETSP1140-20130426/67350_1 /TAXON_ID=298111 /ORGANISM="Pavlova sp., Strain CCMP459" /LENGTH=174 /DNA_ID=CAMNT_0027779931 /DNA_START=830 /DNA_END=1351 /DNA_ORIENTATION=-
MTRHQQVVRCCQDTGGDHARCSLQGARVADGRQHSCCTASALAAPEQSEAAKGAGGAGITAMPNDWIHCNHSVLPTCFSRARTVFSSCLVAVLMHEFLLHAELNTILKVLEDELAFCVRLQLSLEELVFPPRAHACRVFGFEFCTPFPRLVHGPVTSVTMILRATEAMMQRLAQ